MGTVSGDCQLRSARGVPVYEAEICLKLKNWKLIEANPLAFVLKSKTLKTGVKDVVDFSDFVH